MEIKIVQHYDDMDEKFESYCECVEIFIDGALYRIYDTRRDYTVKEEIQDLTIKTEKVADIHFGYYRTEDEEEW